MTNSPEVALLQAPKPGFSRDQGDGEGGEGQDHVLFPCLCLTLPSRKCEKRLRFLPGV